MKHHSGAKGYDIGSDYGTWEWLVEYENIIKFTDARGNSHETAVEKEDGKLKIKYCYYGIFEK